MVRLSMSRLLIALAAGLFSPTAGAAVLKYNFQGTITQPTHGIPLGTAFTGSFSFDTSVPFIDFIGDAYAVNAVKSYEFTVGTFSGSAATGSVRQNQFDTTEQQYFLTRAARIAGLSGHTGDVLTGTSLLGLPLFESYVRLQDLNGDLFASVTSPIGQLNVTYALDFYAEWRQGFEAWGTRGRITSLSLVEESAVAAVPGPIVGAGLPGLAVALGALVMWWRRRALANEPAEHAGFGATLHYLAPMSELLRESRRIAASKACLR